MDKRFIRTALFLSIVLCVYFFVVTPVIKAVLHPNEIVLTETEYMQISNQDKFSPVGGTTDGEKYITVKVLGFIPIKKVLVNILPFETIIVGGTPIGICGEIDGVLVTADCENNNLKKGDVIVEVNNEKIQNIEQFKEKTKNTKKVELTIIRNKKQVTKKITDVSNLALRDKTNGVGMLTFINPENNNFSALGHQMGDFETGAAVNLRGGEIKTVNTFGIDKTTGRKTGVIKSSIKKSSDSEGSITKGTKYGVTGCLKANSEILTASTTTMPIATRYNVKPGKATIRTSLDGLTVEEFECEILKTRYQENKGDKSMVIRVTDKRLLEKTGGIVHGMSGSPIIQKGHIVGALTHAITHDASKGYAIYIDFVAI